MNSQARLWKRWKEDMREGLMNLRDLSNEIFSRPSKKFFGDLLLKVLENYGMLSGLMKFSLVSFRSIFFRDFFKSGECPFNHFLLDGIGNPEITWFSETSPRNS